MRVLFGIDNEATIESIVKIYEKNYGERIEYKKTFFFGQFRQELMNGDYDIAVLKEDLDKMTTKSYAEMDKQIYDFINSVTDSFDAKNLIIICSERRKKGDDFLRSLFNIGVYTTLTGQERTKGKLAEVIHSPITKKEARKNFEGNGTGANYTEVPEIELRRIRSYFNNLGGDTSRYNQIFASVASQYTTDQMVIVIRFLPKDVVAFLEQNSDLYKSIIEEANLNSEMQKQQMQQQAEQQAAELAAQQAAAQAAELAAQQAKAEAEAAAAQAKKQAIEQKADAKATLQQQRLEQQLAAQKAQAEKMAAQQAAAQAQQPKVATNNAGANGIEIQKGDELAKKIVVNEKKEAETQPPQAQGTAQTAQPAQTVQTAQPTQQTTSQAQTQPAQQTTVQQTTAQTAPKQPVQPTQPAQQVQQPVQPVQPVQQPVQTPVQPVKPVQQTPVQPQKTTVREPEQTRVITQVTEKEVVKQVFDVPKDYRKTVVFVGAPKVGTTFCINAIGTYLTRRKVKTAYVDMTRKRDLYTIYTYDNTGKRNIAGESLRYASAGKNEPLVYDKLSIYTAVPGEDRKSYNPNVLIDTVTKYNNVVLIDADFSTPLDYFRRAQNIYVVQDMNVLNIQQVTMFLRELKQRGIGMDKIKIIVNKHVDCDLSTRDIVDGIAMYTSYDLRMYDELFNSKKVQYFELPFDVENYKKYIDMVFKYSNKFSSFSQAFQTSLEDIINTIYPTRGEVTIKENHYTEESIKKKKKWF